MKKTPTMSFITSASVIASVVFLSAATPSFAVPISEAKTASSVAHSLGTKASEEYENEGRAGGPIYEYGKGIQLGAVHITPNIGYSYAWDNNIFYDEGGRKEDYINRLNTGLTAELPFGGGQHLFSASWDTFTEWFERYSAQNHTDHTLGAGVKLNYVPFSLSAEDHFLRTVDRSGTEFTTRVPRNENTIHGLLEVPFSSFFLETETSNLTEDYRNADNKAFNHNDFNIYQRVGIDISGNNQFLVEYGYKNINYAENKLRNGDANQFMLGLRGNLTERVSYQIWNGAQYRIYDQASLPDFNGYVMRGAIQYAISDDSYIALRGERLPQESTYDNQSFYVRNHSELQWKQQIAERLFFNTTEMLDYNRYSRITVLDNTERTRRDVVWATGVGLEYVLPSHPISLTLDYKFSARESNTATVGYDDQTIMAGAKATF